MSDQPQKDAVNPNIKLVSERLVRHQQMCKKFDEEEWIEALEIGKKSKGERRVNWLVVFGFLIVGSFLILWSAS